MTKTLSSQYLNRFFMGLPHTNAFRAGILLEKPALAANKMLLKNSGRMNFSAAATYMGPFRGRGKAQFRGLALSLRAAGSASLSRMRTWGARRRGASWAATIRPGAWQPPGSERRSTPHDVLAPGHRWCPVRALLEQLLAAGAAKGRADPGAGSGVIARIRPAERFPSR